MADTDTRNEGTWKARGRLTQDNMRRQNGKDWETKQQDIGRNENDEGQKRIEKMD